jgi:putative NADPH-quinone reductase
MSKVVLALSGSLRKPSFTEKMLALCLEGMGTDLEVHKFYPHKMDIKPCISCWSCWKKTNGQCVQKDDFQQIVDVYVRADYFIIAAPLYYFSFPATVKNAIDRFFCFLEPSQHPSDRGGTEHPKRGGHHPKTALISSCGFPELENLNLLSALFKRICADMDWTHSGEILVPAAGAANVPKLFDRKLERIRQAGAELVTGRITQETTSAIAQPVMPVEDYRAMCTASFSGLLGKARAVAIAMKSIGWKPPTDGHGNSDPKEMPEHL